MITAKEALSRTKEARLLEVENMILSEADKGRSKIYLNSPSKNILNILEESGYVIKSDDKTKDCFYVYWEV